MQGLSFSQFLLKHEWDKLHEMAPGYLVFIKNKTVALIFKNDSIEYTVFGNSCNCPAGKYRGHCKHKDWVKKLRREDATRGI